MENYIQGPLLGKGTYGSVRKAFCKKTGQPVAIKLASVADAQEGIHITVLQEIKLLQEIKHPNVIKLIEVFPHRKNIAMVLELAVADLEFIIRDANLVLSPADTKAFVLMTFQAVSACHESWVLHCDLKPNNFLIGADGAVKLADFGLSRIFGSPNFRYVNMLFARWYRPPELFFGATRFGGAADVWAAGCIFAELLLRKPLFHGETDVEQLSRVFAVRGTPDEQDWPGVSQLPAFVEFSVRKPVPLRSVIPGAPADALDLLDQMLQLNPNKRISMAEALKHPYFTNAPAPTPLSQLHHAKSAVRAKMDAAAAAAAQAVAQRKAIQSPSQQQQLLAKAATSRSQIEVKSPRAVSPAEDRERFGSDLSGKTSPGSTIGMEPPLKLRRLNRSPLPTGHKSPAAAGS